MNSEYDAVISCIEPQNVYIYMRNADCVFDHLVDFAVF